MDCVLIRHGIAVEREDWKGQESQRPLTPRGVERTREAASGLRRLDLAPTHLFSSPFVRAVETARIIRDELRLHEEVRTCQELLPDAAPEKLLALLDQLPEDACAVFVGHEPNLGQGAGLMLAGKPLPGLSLKKAGACCIRFEGAPKAGQGLLQWWLAPARLRKLRKS